MPKLKVVVDKIEDVAETLRELYTKGSDGKYHLDADIEDTTTLHSALKSEREQSKATAKQLKELKEKLGDLDPEKAREALKVLQDMEEKKLLDAGEIEKLLGTRTERMRQDFENQKGSFNKKITDLEADKGKLSQRLSEVLIDNAIREAAAKAKVKSSAIPDAILRGKQIFRLQEDKVVPMKGDQVIYGKNPNEPMSIDEWMGSMATEASHWFESSSGGGAGNGAGGGAGKVITLSREQAKDPAQYRAAKEQAAKSGSTLQVAEA